MKLYEDSLWTQAKPTYNVCFFSGEGPRSRRNGRTAALRLLVQPCDEDDDDDDYFCPFSSNGAPVEWNWNPENRSTRRKTCPGATLSTTNPTRTEPGSNTGLRGGRPAANRLSHGTAQYLQCLQYSVFILVTTKYFGGVKICVYE
jgi:hypothetical protein